MPRASTTDNEEKKNTYHACVHAIDRNIALWMQTRWMDARSRKNFIEARVRIIVAFRDYTLCIMLRCA